MGRLRILAGQEVCFILSQHGFKPIRQRGSHRIMHLRREGSTITIPVPMHPELTAGTLSSIIRQSGLPRSLFECEL